jgi:hypothetical protein
MPTIRVRTFQLVITPRCTGVTWGAVDCSWSKWVIALLTLTDRNRCLCARLNYAQIASDGAQKPLYGVMIRLMFDL